MENDSGFKRLLRPSAVAVALGALLVVLCYFFVDRPVATFVHEHAWNRIGLFEWLTVPPPIVQAWTPAVLVLLMVRRAWGPWRPWERALVAASLALIVADQFKESMAFVAGRLWPDTWVNDNPSWIRDGAFGFHPFHGGRGYESFPSGHTCRTGAVAAVLWIGFPRARWMAVLMVAAVAAGLLGMNYHFVGDVVSGGFVGVLVGAWTARAMGVGAGSAEADRS